MVKSFFNSVPEPVPLTSLKYENPLLRRLYSEKKNPNSSITRKTLAFLDTPIQGKIPNLTHILKEQQLLVDQEIPELLKEVAIQKVAQTQRE